MAVDSSQTYSVRTLQRLDELIQACRDNDERLVLFAKKAGQLARLSELTEARSLVTKLRSVNSAYDPRVSAWVLFAEGLIQHFDNLDNSRTKDKFNRAFLVSQMAGDRELAGASAAWMAHCELMAGQMKDVAGHIAKAFEWSDSDSGEARGRASMVLADALNWAGEREEARHWYREARRHAVRDGDLAMQNVMLYNAAALGVWHLTLMDCVSTTSVDEQKRASMDAASATNLNTALGIESLSSLLPIMHAELSIVQGDWPRALALLDQHIAGLVQEGQLRLQPKMLAQRAWCRANLGDRGGAYTDVQEALEHLDDCADLDDLAVLHFRIAAVGANHKDTALESRHRTAGSTYLSLFRSQQAETVKLLRPVLAAILSDTKNPA